MVLVTVMSYFVTTLPSIHNTAEEMFSFQQGSAPAQRAHDAFKYLSQQSPAFIPLWSPNSPDLNPVNTKSGVAAETGLPSRISSVDHLQQCLLKGWHCFDHRIIEQADWQWYHTVGMFDYVHVVVKTVVTLSTPCSLVNTGNFSTLETSVLCNNFVNVSYKLCKKFASLYQLDRISCDDYVTLCLSYIGLYFGVTSIGTLTLLKINYNLDICPLWKRKARCWI